MKISREIFVIDFIITLFMLAGCQRNEPIFAVKLSDLLPQCSPFSTYNGSNGFSFSRDHTYLELHPLTGGFFGFFAHNNDLKGTWSGQENTRTFSIISPLGQRQIFTIYTPIVSDTCIMTVGIRQPVLLTNAFYGNISNNDDDDGDDNGD